MTFLSAMLSIAAAAFFGLSSAMQQRAAKQQQRRPALDPRLLLRLLRSPLWLFGWLPDFAGTGLQAVALRFGPLALVQPLLVSGLFLAIPLEAILNRTRPHVRDMVAVGVGGVGLAAFLITAQPRGGVSDPSIEDWIGVGAGSTGVIATCLILAGRSHDAARGALLGAATGVLTALIAALFKPIATAITQDPLGLLTDWHIYALIVVGIAMLLLNQNAFQSGRLAAPLTTLTLVDPVVSVAIAVTAFREKLSIGGPRLAIEIVGALAMAGGIWLASSRRGARP
jgi:drug/metabolite transporter (DMT)-like permease